MSENDGQGHRPAPEIARAIELAISRTLAAGVLLASSLIGTGLVFLLLNAYAGGAQPTIQDFLAPSGAEPYVLRSPGEVYSGLLQREPNAIVDLGLFVLMATPVASLLLSGLQFLLERDYKFVAIALLVFGVIAASFSSGFAR